jgi:hypothetical protein
MRLIKTFILRLYMDSELRDQTCGDLQALPGRKTFPFKNNAELLNLIHQLANEEAKDSPMRISQGENESNSCGAK